MVDDLKNQKDLVQQHIDSELTYSITVTARHKKLTNMEKNNLIESIGIEEFKGKIDLSHPDWIFVIYENYEKKTAKGNIITMIYKQAYLGLEI